MTTENNDATPVRLGDRYELGRLLGRGGMAEVHLARDLRLGRTVAIKQLRVDLAADPVFQERFRREAQSAASLNHPAVVAVYDTGETIKADGSHVPYIVMEYIEGQTLREVLRDGRRILPERALEITGEILSALDYSHRAGIVHRDIKPANVMVTPEGKVKVMDFGIARAIADSASAMTQTAAVIGTAQYLSPEQARGETVDARSDIYSTGCVLYELLTGRPPFVGDSPVSIAYQHVREDAQPPSQLNADVSSSVDAIVAHALAKSVVDRYQSAAEMRSDVNRVLQGLTVTHDVSQTQVVSATQIAPAIGSRRAEVENPNRKKIVWASVIGAIALIGLGTALYFMFQDDTQMVAVPDVRTKTYEAAERELTTLGFVVTREDVEDAEVEVGRVVSQNPAANSNAAYGSTVLLTVSSGPGTVEIPDVIGDQFEVAKKALEALGLKVASPQMVDDPAPAGQVLSSDPTVGTAVEPGSTVTLRVSQGRIPVENLTGLTEQEAVAKIESAGLTARVRYRDTLTDPPGTVVDQNPASGNSALPGSTVTIWVARVPGEQNGGD